MAPGLDVKTSSHRLRSVFAMEGFSGFRNSRDRKGWTGFGQGRDLVKLVHWAILISLLERPSSRTRSGLSDRPLMSTDGRDGQD